MQGLYDIYDTMNTYIKNDIWNDNPSSIDSIQNIEYLKVSPDPNIHIGQAHLIEYENQAFIFFSIIHESLYITKIFKHM